MSDRRNSVPGGLPNFRERTDPLVLRGMRFVMGHYCPSPRCEHMPTPEREALDAWLSPRVEALAEQLIGAFRVRKGAA